MPPSDGGGSEADDLATRSDAVIDVSPVRSDNGVVGLRGHAPPQPSLQMVDRICVAGYLCTDSECRFLHPLPISSTLGAFGWERRL